MPVLFVFGERDAFSAIMEDIVVETSEMGSTFAIPNIK